ncbi:MAG: hypothetical protein IJ389_00905 [Clostridia bacterium]|nr:hypothetical protein [Clostridia bacterium]
MKRILSFIILACVTVSCLSGCSFVLPGLETLENEAENKEIIEAKWFVKDEDIEVEGFKAVNDSKLLQYSMINGKEKELYDVINEAILSGTNRLDVEGKGYSVETVEKVFSLVKADHPEYFYVTDDFEYKYYVGETDVTIILIKFTDGKVVDAFDEDGNIVRCADRELIAERVSDFRKKVTEILEKLPDDGSQLELEKSIHDYLVDNIEYYSGTINFDAVPLPDYMNVYGGLNEGIGICQTYTKLMQYLCILTGINASQVSGYSHEGEAHMWNVVEIEGQWYQLDVTWDDPVLAEDVGEDYRCYDYFNLTDHEILADHTIDDDYNYIPACKSTECRPENYFYVKFMGYNAEPVNLELMADSIEQGDEDYVYIYMGASEVNGDYLSKYFFNYDSPFNEYIDKKNYSFELGDRYFYSDKYCFIPVER